MNDITFKTLPIGNLQASATNPRKHFDPIALAELAESIKQQGLAQPILVRPIAGSDTFEIVAGERRYRASKLAGNDSIIAIVRDLSDLEALELQVIENLQRADLHPMEEAQGYDQLMKAHNFTADQLSEKVGKSKSYIYNRLKLLDLVAKGQEAFYEGKLNSATALLVARIPVKDLQHQAVKEITTSSNYRRDVMTSKEAQQHIHEKYMLQLKSAPFKTSDATLVPSAGACSTCPKRTGNQPLLFADVESADTCTDTVCFGLKREAGKQRTIANAKEMGQPIISGATAKKIKPYNYSSELKEGYVSLDTICWQDDKRRNYGQLVGRKSPVVSLMEDPHSDNLISVVKLADIKSLLEEKGIKASASSSVSQSAQTREQEAKVKIEREYRRRLFVAVREKSPGLVDRDVLNNIAAKLLLNTPHNERPFLMTLYGFDKAMHEYPKAQEKTHAVMCALDDKTVTQLIIDCMLANDLSVSSYGTDGKPEQLLAAAGLVDVDAAKIKAGVKAEAKAKIDAKKKKPEPAKKMAKAPTKKAAPAPVKKATDTGVLNPAVAWPFPTEKATA